jgi:hypothetical protein
MALLCVLIFLYSRRFYMSTVIRVVESADGKAHTLQIPGYDTINPVTVPSSGTYDLLTTMSPETLHALQPGLNLAVTEGELTVITTITIAELWAMASGSSGVDSVYSNSNPMITGAVQFVSGTNISLSQTGNAITVNSTASSGITALTGDVTASGSGSVPATVVSAGGGTGAFASGVTTVTNLKTALITGDAQPLVIVPSTDSVTAIEIQSAGTLAYPLITIDTIDGFVGIGNTTGGGPHRTLDVRGNASVNSDFLAGTIHINGVYFYLEALDTQAAITGTVGVAGQMAVASDTQNLLIYANGAWNTVNVTPV